MASEPYRGPRESAPPARSDSEQREWLRVTLASIGDAVITRCRRPGDVPEPGCAVPYRLGAGRGDRRASGPCIRDRQRSDPPDGSRIRHASVAGGLVVGLANDTILIAKDGTERPVDHSAAPIRNARGGHRGVVLVFRDVTERRRKERAVQNTLAYVQGIVETIRESLIVLDKNLRVMTANRTFYKTFHVAPEVRRTTLSMSWATTIGTSEAARPAGRDSALEPLFHDFEVEHDFPTIGRKTMLLNARRVRRGTTRPP